MDTPMRLRRSIWSMAAKRRLKSTLGWNPFNTPRTSRGSRHRVDRLRYVPPGKATRTACRYRVSDRRLCWRTRPRRTAPAATRSGSGARRQVEPNADKGHRRTREALRKSLDVVEGVDVERRRGEGGDG